MFNHKPVEPVATVQADAAPPELVALSVLALDLDVPVEGWPSFLAARHIETTLDDLGRMSISRGDARRLLTEQREAEARGRVMAAEADLAAVEAYQSWRAGVWRGVPVDRMPSDVSPATAMLAAAADAQPKRLSPLEESLSNSPAMTYHAYPANPDEE